MPAPYQIVRFLQIERHDVLFVFLRPRSAILREEKVRTCLLRSCCAVFFVSVAGTYEGRDPLGELHVERHLSA